VLDAGTENVAAKGGRTAVAYRDTRSAADQPASSTSPELMATAAAVPPVATAPRPPAGPGDDDGSSGGGRRVLLLALLAVVVLVVGILAAVLTRGGNAPSSPTAATTAAAAPASVATRDVAPSTQAAPITTTTTASAQPPTTSAEVPVGVQSPVAFIQGYYGLLPGNTDAAWALLGPTAQSQSGGRDGFNSFYGGLIRVWSENLRVTGNTVSATIVFTDRSGRVTREPYQFVLGSSDGRQVIESFSRG
jgi:hypothetical protein